MEEISSNIQEELKKEKYLDYISNRIHSQLLETQKDSFNSSLIFKSLPTERLKSISPNEANAFTVVMDFLEKKSLLSTLEAFLLETGRFDLQSGGYGKNVSAITKNEFEKSDLIFSI
jgi:hypothetical protein